MTAIDKIGVGMGIFTGVFMVVTIVFPKRAFARYYRDLRARKRDTMVKQLVMVVSVLSVPYFYDILVGLKSEFLSLLIELLIGLAAILVLADVVWYIYKTYGPPSQPRRP